MSFSLGSRFLASSKPPISYATAGEIGNSCEMLTPRGSRSRRSMYWGKVSQSTLIETCMGSSGIASLRDRASIARSASCARSGAKPKPQLPSVTDVIPCQLPIVQ